MAYSAQDAPLLTVAFAAGMGLPCCVDIALCSHPFPILLPPYLILSKRMGVCVRVHVQVCVGTVVCMRMHNSARQQWRGRGGEGEGDGRRLKSRIEEV